MRGRMHKVPCRLNLRMLGESKRPLLDQSRLQRKAMRLQGVVSLLFLEERKDFDKFDVRLKMRN